MNAACHDPWVLGGPWYRWTRPGIPSSGRLSRPVFQKYETAKLVEEFMKEPQRSLKFLDEDYFHELQPRVPPLPLFNGLKQSLSDNLMVKTDTRKLFLDTHKRFYLVVAELHCDTAGFPSASRDQVCEAGFVVRRRVADVPGKADRAARDAVRQLALAKLELAQANEPLLARKAGTTLLHGQRGELLARSDAATAELRDVANRWGIRVRLEGWVPSGFEHVGSWQEVEEHPQTIVEEILPMYPLIPDPNIRDHSARGRTIYFGLVPTASADTNDASTARFDERTLYELRCFVRRHRPPCPKLGRRNDCKGEIVWSRRTEPYRLAAQTDLTGTSNRPITIQLPDLPALEAQAANLAPGQGAPIRMIAPEESNLDFKVNVPDLTAENKGRSAAICSFSIPLITIVATFVLKLFLPVVTFLFGLFFLLKLKFCIPPSFSLNAGVAAGLTADLDANLDIGFQVAIQANILAELGAEAYAGFDGNPGLGTTYSPAVLAGYTAELSADFSASAPEGVELPPPGPNTVVSGTLPPITANLIYEERIEVPA
jgi:hypothetical protein